MNIAACPICPHHMAMHDDDGYCGVARCLHRRSFVRSLTPQHKPGGVAGATTPVTPPLNMPYDPDDDWMEKMDEWRKDFQNAKVGFWCWFAFVALCMVSALAILGWALVHVVMHFT